MLSPFIRDYTLRGIAGLPPVLFHLLKNLDDNSPLWDQRPDPDRFSLREILPHMAEFDEVWHYRITRILNEESPALPDWDEDAAVTLNNYAATVPSEQLTRLTSNRATLSQLLNGLPPESWDREASRPQVGTFSIKDATLLILAHDAYHTQQITEWLTILEK